MLNWKEFTVQLVQATIFTPDLSKFVTGKAVAAILAKFRERFDGEMQVLPLPQEAPAVLPRIVLQSGDESWRLNMGPSRLDCIWSNKPASPPPSLPLRVKECAEVPQHYALESSVGVNRVALVVHRVFPVENAAQKLIGQFCSVSSQQEPFNRSETFETHNHKVYVPGHGIDYQINSWVRCKSVTLAVDNRPAILVEQDLNSLAPETDTRRFAGPEMHAFFEAAGHESDDILRKYFPHQESS